MTVSSVFFRECTCSSSKKVKDLWPPGDVLGIQFRPENTFSTLFVFAFHPKVFYGVPCCIEPVGFEHRYVGHGRQ